MNKQHLLLKLLCCAFFCLFMGCGLHVKSIQFNGDGSDTDYKCASDCAQSGYMYDFCQEKCSYNKKPRQQPRKSKSVDYKCASDCAQRGYMYDFCQENCSY
jgi:hypothetical protein